MGVCTLADVKARLGIAETDTEHDVLLGKIIAGVSGEMAREAGRPTLEKSDQVDLLTVRGVVPYLSVWVRPIVTITEVKEALYKAFDDADALVEDTDYVADYRGGGLQRCGAWLPGMQTVRVTYTGGYTTPDQQAAPGYVQGATEVLMPGDIIEAAIKQATYVFRNRDKLGLTSMGARGGSVSGYAGDELLPGVKATMRRYRRIAGG